MTRSKTPQEKSTAALPPYAVRSSTIHGNGVFARRKIPAGTLIIEYEGERISWKEALRREELKAADSTHTFLFSLEDGRVIDGGSHGNDARWINHACEPNCEAQEEDGRVFIYALRDIARGEELNYNYALVLDQRHTPAIKRAYACRCGAPSCRKTMLAPKPRKRSAA
jgi:SET domain-containing protein